MEDFQSLFGLAKFTFMISVIFLFIFLVDKQKTKIRVAEGFFSFISAVASVVFSALAMTIIPPIENYYVNGIYIVGLSIMVYFILFFIFSLKGSGVKMKERSSF